MFVTRTEKKIQKVGVCVAESHRSYLMCFKMIFETEMGPYKLLAVLAGCKNAFPVVFPSSPLL